VKIVCKTVQKPIADTQSPLLQELAQVRPGSDRALPSRKNTQICMGGPVVTGERLNESQYALKSLANSSNCS
jgi:hypothetical protein